MNCLNSSDLQAIVDGEATESQRAHVAACDRCRRQVDARRSDLATLVAAATAGDISPAFEARMRDALSDERTTRGATTLRVNDRRRAPHRRAWVSAALAAAAIAIVVFMVLPKVGAPATLSASEVLGRSLQTMTGARGVELLEYQLFLPGNMSASHRIEHLIDHDHPGRHRFSNYGPDGALESSIGRDPQTGHRFALVRSEGRGVLINVEDGTSPQLSLPEMIQAVIETGITMMQATSDQSLAERETPEGRQYVIDMPRVVPKSSAAVIDLYSARAVVDAKDFRILEFEASGTVLQQPYSMSFKLIRRSIRPSADVASAEFEPPTLPSDVVINARADGDPISGVVGALVREVHRGKGH